MDTQIYKTSDKGIVIMELSISTCIEKVELRPQIINLVEIPRWSISWLDGHYYPSRTGIPD